jgi:hypothetical protein
MTTYPVSIQRIRETAPCWISAATLLNAAVAIDQDPSVLHGTAELALRASATVQDPEARIIRSIVEGALRGLRPDPAALALVRRWRGTDVASDRAWDLLAELQFTGRVHALTGAEIAAHKDRPVLAIYDADVVIDLVTGPAIALIIMAEGQIEVWRGQARSGRGAVYLPSAGHSIALNVEAAVADAFGFGDAVAAGAPIHSANLRYGFTSYGGDFPSDFGPDKLEVIKELAWARELPGSELMPQMGS